MSNLLIAKRLGHLRPSSKRLLISANIVPRFCQKYILTDFEKLLVRFNVHPGEALELPVSPKEFINVELSKSVNIIEEFAIQGKNLLMNEIRTFSFFNHPFILTPVNKVEKLFFSNQLCKINERHRSLFHTA